jgi:hypothetical protein
MNEIDFEAKLRDDGYTEIETQDLQPRPAKGQHGHPFSIRGLVLAGTFIVTQGRSAHRIRTRADLLLSTRNARTTSRSVPTAHASWSVVSIKSVISRSIELG